MDDTKIEWTDATWNPVVGCDKVSPGCDNCYAETIAKRFAGSKAYPDGFAVTLKPERLEQPLRWTRPRRIFVNSMSDLFHRDVPAAFVAKVFAVMRAAQAHTFQLLTKRHARMRSLLRSLRFEGMVTEEALRHGLPYPTESWPLPNVWLGVSVETQQWADLRIPALLDTPAAVRWLSCEPLLGPVDLQQRPAHVCPANAPCPRYIHGLDWVVVGGESGPGARPMELAWAESLVAQCQGANVPVFVKQLGSHWGKQHHDISAFPESLQVREYPAGAS